MGERGPIPKPGRPDYGISKADLEKREPILRPTTVEHPAPAEEWSPTTATAWLTFWDSYVALQIEGLDVPAVVRMFGLMDRMERMWAVVEKDTDGTFTVTTEKSGEKAHPLIASIKQLDTMLDSLERQFGVRPASRMRLGLHGLAAQAAQEKMAGAASKRGRVVDNGEAGPTPPDDDEVVDGVVLS